MNTLLQNMNAKHQAYRTAVAINAQVVDHLIDRYSKMAKSNYLPTINSKAWMRVKTTTTPPIPPTARTTTTTAIVKAAAGAEAVAMVTTETNTTTAARQQWFLIIFRCNWHCFHLIIKSYVFCNWFKCIPSQIRNGSSVCVCVQWKMYVLTLEYNMPRKSNNNNWHLAANIIRLISLWNYWIIQARARALSHKHWYNETNS